MINIDSTSDQNLVSKAINLALKSNWNDAIKANKQIIENDLSDIEALNRLAKAYYETGNIKLAKKTSLAVLKVEPTNKISLKALDKYQKNNADFNSGSGQNINISDFIEEVGITKQATLINLCSKKLISLLDSGDEVFLSTHSHRVSVTTKENRYIGRLPDDLSAKLKALCKNGYKYRVLIKSADHNYIKILIKEVERGKNFENVQSFPHDTSEPISEFNS